MTKAKTNKTKSVITTVVSKASGPALGITLVSPQALTPYAQNVRTHSPKQINQIARSINDFGFNNPILIDDKLQVIAGHGRLAAALKMGLAEVPTIRLDHMTEMQKRAYILADNKLAEKAGWDHDILKIELASLLEFDIDLDLTITGFETPEIDLIMNDVKSLKHAKETETVPGPDQVPRRVARGDLWQLGSHYLYCGDSLELGSFDTLLSGKKANLIFTDPPYNVPVAGHVCGKGQTQHSEFAYASGEMTSKQFTAFLRQIFATLADNSLDGSIHYVCMDWRHIQEITAAADDMYSSLKNVCVWNKQLGGMGSLYRSQHELIFVFKNGESEHVNNIELGKHGRYRTNVWDYAGVHATSAKRGDLKFHPTVKPVAMIADAIVDCSKVGDIVLDCFGGSGSTLLAAEKVKRKAYLIEFEPKYCDVTLYRFEQLTGIKPIRVMEANND